MSKQNAVDLARTARSEAESITKGDKRTIAAIINNWNECVKQAGFWCIYDFPTTGYTRKTQLVADLLRCADQLDEYVEPNPHAAQTVEQQTRELNAALTRVLDVEEAHAEALEMNAQHDENSAFAAMWIAQDSRLIDCLINPTLIEADHVEALQWNAFIDHCWPLDVEDVLVGIEISAHEDNRRFDWLANRWSLFWAGCDYFTRRTMIEEAHTEAIAINHKKNAMQNAGKAGAVYAFHDEIVGKHNTVWEALEEWEDMHSQALKINVLIDHILYKRKHDRRWRTKYLLTWQISILIDEDDSYVTDEYLLAWKIALRVEKITASNLETVLAP
ncbi:hypothetical protein ACQ7NX_00750 [Enterobacter cloacae subsp. dissolvens]